MKFRSMLAALLAVIFMICGVAMAETANPIEITIWHTFTDDQQVALQGFADDFNESQDQYEVIVQSQAYSGFEDTVYNAVANGVGPNIIFNYASTAADYIEGDLVVDMSQYINEDPEMQEIYDSLPEAIKAETVGFIDGGMYALPAVTTGPIFFYNKTIYDEMGFSAPTTWEELAEQAKAIYETYGIPGFAADSLTDLMTMLIMQSGNEYIDMENKCVLFDTESTREWLQWFGDNVQAGYFGLRPTGDYWSDDFNAKLVASYSGSCAGVPYIVPDGFEYDVAPLPNTITTAWYPSWNRGPIVFNQGEEANRGAYEFVKFFLQPDNNAQWAIAMNAISPYGTTQEQSEVYQEFAAEMPASLAAVQANLDAAGALPTISGSYAVREALEEAATMVAGGMSVEDALANCVATSNAAMQG